MNTMARGPRRLSQSGIYHVIVRGINRQNIFQEDKDYEKYLEVVGRMKDRSKCIIHAYCLMDNHVHMLLKEGDESIGTFMKRVGAGYVRWFNNKYDRQGHLFQGRYKREVVGEERYYLTVLRYILQNPVKAGMVSCMAEYKYSNWIDYIYENRGLIETELAFTIAGGKEALGKFLEQGSSNCCMDAWDGERKRDDEVSLIVRNMTNKAPVELQSSLKKDRDHVLRILKDTPGISIRQIERVTGIGRGTIYKAS